MPFPKKNVLATKVGRLQLTLVVDSNDSVTVDDASIMFGLLDADGKQVGDNYTFNLIPHLTNPQKVTLFSLMNALRTKVTNEVL